MTQSKHELAVRNLGAVYTPGPLADWVATLLTRFLPSNPGPIVDPACGDGALLHALRRNKRDWELVGVDVNGAATTRARRTLGNQIKLFTRDALIPMPSRRAIEGWYKLLGGRQAGGIIANPPWGARPRHSREALAQAGYVLARGQFDSFELFMELTLGILEKNGIGAFIVPDSIFLPEHQKLRALLLKCSSLLVIARLGEGFFDTVYRGAVVVVFRNASPSEDHIVECLRINKQWRDQIFSGEKTIYDAERSLKHPVPQSRFIGDPATRFDIDLTERECAPIAKLEQHIDGWTDWLQSGRGVELSKKGYVLICPYCEYACPAPRTLGTNHKCIWCGTSYRLTSARREQIIYSTQPSRTESEPIIVGEDVNRYAVQPSRFIRTGVRGINYKTDAIFKDRKIVIRKTGVGIKAAIDTTGALTNQVVFIYSLRLGMRTPSFLLDYFLGVLCSRIMLAYYLKKVGENEWRSHPYITQRVISELPVPNVREGTKEWAQARAIAHAVTQRSKSNLIDDDLIVERLVAGLFQLSKQDCAWVINVLESAQSLEPIRTMRVAAGTLLNPICIT